MGIADFIFDAVHPKTLPRRVSLRTKQDLQIVGLKTGPIASGSKSHFRNLRQKRKRARPPLQYEFFTADHLAYP